MDVTTDQETADLVAEEQEPIAPTESPPSYSSISDTPPAPAAGGTEPGGADGPPATAPPPPYLPPPPGDGYGTQTYYYVEAGPVYPPPRRQPQQKYIGHICFACIVMFFFNCIFGIVALILASQSIYRHTISIFARLHIHDFAMHPPHSMLAFVYQTLLESDNCW